MCVCLCNRNIVKVLFRESHADRSSQSEISLPYSFVCFTSSPSIHLKCVCVCVCDARTVVTLVQRVCARAPVSTTNKARSHQINTHTQRGRKGNSTGCSQCLVLLLDAFRRSQTLRSTTRPWVTGCVSASAGDATRQAPHSVPKAVHLERCMGTNCMRSRSCRTPHTHTHTQTTCRSIRHRMRRLASVGSRAARVNLINQFGVTLEHRRRRIGHTQTHTHTQTRCDHNIYLYQYGSAV